MSGQVASVIDEQQIGGLAEAAGIDGVKAILDAFWDSIEELATELVSALKTNDGAVVARIGHTLKGSSANIGAARMADRARDIEQAGKTGQLAEVQGALVRFQQDIADTRAAIDEILNRYA